MPETTPSPDRRLLVDVMCGGIVPYLRLCGYDTAYAGDRGLLEDDALLAVAAHEDRTIVTRDRALADCSDRVLFLESRDTEAQLREIYAAGIPLVPADRPRRCGSCNGLLQLHPPGSPTPPAVPDPAERKVWICRSCEQHFWMGSHWDRMAATLERVRDSTTD